MTRVTSFDKRSTQHWKTESYNNSGTQYCGHTPFPCCTGAVDLQRGIPIKHELGIYGRRLGIHSVCVCVSSYVHNASRPQSSLIWHARMSMRKYDVGCKSCFHSIRWWCFYVIFIRFLVAAIQRRMWMHEQRWRTQRTVISVASYIIHYNNMGLNYMTIVLHHIENRILQHY